MAGAGVLIMNLNNYNPQFIHNKKSFMVNKNTSNLISLYSDAYFFHENSEFFPYLKKKFIPGLTYKSVWDSYADLDPSEIILIPKFTIEVKLYFHRFVKVSGNTALAVMLDQYKSLFFFALNDFKSLIDFGETEIINNTLYYTGKLTPYKNFGNISWRQVHS